MELPDRRAACCFSGYRPEKMPVGIPTLPLITEPLYSTLRRAVCRAYAAGCTCFLTGMGRGFDLWAAQAVLHLRRELPIRLLCVLPFAGQSDRWDVPWRSVHRAVCAHADGVLTLSPQYHTGCYHARNRFLADASCHLICFYDGRTGGTRYTVCYATAAGLTIQNLAQTP